MAHVALVAFGDGGEMRQCEISKSPYLLCVIFAFRAKEFSFIWPFWVDLSNENTERISSHASKCMSVVWAREKNGNTNTVEKSLSERLLLNAIKNISSIVECYFIIIMIFLFCFFGWFVHYCHFGWLVCVCDCCYCTSVLTSLSRQTSRVSLVLWMCHFSFVSSLCIYIIYACARLFFLRSFSPSPSLRLTLLLWFSFAFILFALEYIYFFVCNLLRSSVCSGCFPFTSSIAHITSSFYLYFRYTQFYFLSLFEFTLILCLCRSYFPPFISFVCFKWEEEQQRKKMNLFPFLLMVCSLSSSPSTFSAVAVIRHFFSVFIFHFSI